MVNFGRFGVTRYEADELYHQALQAYDKNDLENAELNLNKAIELVPNHAEYHAARGLFRLQDGRPEDAEADFETALRHHPYEVLANYGKGILAYERKEYEISLEYFTKAWAAQTERPETLYYLALVNHRMHDNHKALEWMQQARERFDEVDSKKTRRRHADKWISEFEKLIEKESEKITPD